MYVTSLHPGVTREAVREAVLAPDRPVVVTTDCDDTYPMERLPAFLDAINEGYDVVSGEIEFLTGDAVGLPAEEAEMAIANGNTPVT